MAHASHAKQRTGAESGGGLPLTDPPHRRTHKLVVNDEPIEVDVRYSNLVYIARGAYGMVCVADDAVRLCGNGTGRAVIALGAVSDTDGCAAIPAFGWRVTRPDASG